MPLDSYAWKVNQESVVNDFDFSHSEASAYEEIYKWRQNRFLHNWMHNLYKKRGGLGEEFNCEVIRLYPEDLNSLEKDIKENNILKFNQGDKFVFGTLNYDENFKSLDLKFIEIGHKFLKEGFALYYDSWW